jgi:hypothetical protein
MFIGVDLVEDIILRLPRTSSIMSGTNIMVSDFVQNSEVFD